VRREKAESEAECPLVIVLDTQAWVWWVHDPSRLSPRAVRAVRAAEQADHILVSVMSVWEIAVKCTLGKLDLAMDLDAWFRLAMAYPKVVVEPVCALDAIASTRLPGAFHRDPADRIIVALARRHGATLVTADRLIRSYPHVTTVW
jgi:PIN domain nuclease of toxin-antitoxin system